MSESDRRDVDLTVAAEQSSEEGDALEWDDADPETAEHQAIHIDDDNADDDDRSAADLDEEITDEEDAEDPEADALVDAAIDLDGSDSTDAADAEAAALAPDDEEDVELQEEASEDDDVTPYEGSADQEHDLESGRVYGDEAAPDAPIDGADALAEELEAAVETDGDAAFDEAVEDIEIDPYEEFRQELRFKPGKWYVIHSYAGFEKRVKQNIESRRSSMGMEDFVYEVQVPMEDVVEIKNGQRKLVNRVRVPGYVLVRMDLNEDSWSVVRHTPGVTGFVGNAHNPTPLRFEEAFTMLKSLVQPVDVPAKAGATARSGGQAAARVAPAEVDFEIGETITIKEGSFAGLPGTINEIKPESGRLTVLVSLFERETPVELTFEQVTKL